MRNPHFRDNIRKKRSEKESLRRYNVSENKTLTNTQRVKKEANMRLTKKLNKVELKKSEDAVTGRMGLGWLMHCVKDFGLKKMVDIEYKKGNSNNRGHPQWKKLITGTMLLLSGGDRIEGVEVLREDKGLLEVLGWKTMPCADTILNFISKKRNNGRNRKINEGVIIESLRRIKEEELTYDNDATYMDSEKESAEYSYQKKKQFSALIGCIAEVGMVNTVEYRPGNISPQEGILNQLKKAQTQAKKAGKRINRFRSDSAAYQDKIMTYCDKEDIRYYITVDKNIGIKRIIETRTAMDWKTMYGKYKDSDRQWSVAEYVVSKGYKIRVLILRWKNPRRNLFDQNKYSYHVIGTNNWGIDPMEWLEVHNGRMGSIEHINDEIKNGLGCYYTPSHDFEKNRGYFILGVLAHNLAQMMKIFYFDDKKNKWKIKTIRYYFINVCGRIVKSGRRFYCHIINVRNEIFELFRHCKTKLNTCYC